MKDSVDSAVAKNMHDTKNLSIANKTWNDFFYAIHNRKIILYGLNTLVNFLWLRCNEKFSIVAAVDNDLEKQNHKLGELYDEKILNEAKEIKISSRKILEEFNPDEVVILISSYRYYEEIADELENKKFHCYFSVLNLEYNYREEMKKNNLIFESWDEHISNYVNECVEKYPICKDKIIFSMDTYVEHGKYITETLLSMNLNLDIVWIINKLDFQTPEGVRKIYSGKTKQYIFEMETAKIWVYGDVVPKYLIKRKEQIYIQTKHWGSITLKKFFMLIDRNRGAELFVKNGRWIDYIITGSEFDEDSCRKAFDFKGKFLRFGSPRSDVLFSANKYKLKIYEHFNLMPEDHTLLYAPTFRLDNQKNFYDLKWQGLDFELLIQSLKNKWNGNWKIFLRLHPAIKTRSKNIKIPTYVIDASDYEDVQELVAASDVMISDYSSVMFESAYIMRPVFLFAPDKFTYEKTDRELLLDYDSLPFPISTTNAELSKQIINFDEDEYKKTLKSFLNKYGVNEDGHASERAAKFIVKILKD